MMGAKATIHGPWEDMVLFKEMEEMTNIHFNFNTPPATNYQEAKNLAFASQQLPDVFSMLVLHLTMKLHTAAKVIWFRWKD